MRSVIEQFENYAKVNRKLPAETAVQLGQIEEPSKLADAVAANVNIKVSDKQALLAERSAEDIAAANPIEDDERVVATGGSGGARDMICFTIMWPDLVRKLAVWSIVGGTYSTMLLATA